jgi:ABC-type branched-subunit amino acid transport system substrate-binding protein
MKPLLVFRFSLLAFFLLSFHVYADDIVIGMSAAFRGPSKGLGIELFRGSVAYFEHVNERGGINGKRIVLKAYNDGYNPTPAIKNTIDLVERDKVLLLFDYVGTPTVTRILPLLKKYSKMHIYLFFPFTGAQPQREFPYNEYVYNLRTSYRRETEGLVDNFVNIGKKKIAMFYQADAYGRSGWDGVKRALEKYNLKIVGESTYRRGTKYTDSLKQQVEVLKIVEPDAIISIGAYEACAAFIRDARDAGMNVPIANVSFVGSENLLNLLINTSNVTGNDYTHNLINSQVVPSYEDESLPAVQQFKKVMDKYNPILPVGVCDETYKPVKYSFVSFEGFLNAKMLVEIISRMGDNIDKAKLQNVVEGIKNFDIGIDTPISFSHQKHDGLDKVYYTTVKQNRFVPLESWEGKFK